MKFDKNLAAIHSYLCADGYVIKNPKRQNHKYYHIGLRGKTKELLEDFQKKFKRRFRVTPIIKHERCKIGSKPIYYFLTKKDSYYCHKWKMPKLNRNQEKIWLRAFFDCESWVENQPGKNRSIRVECANKKGLEQIRKAIEKQEIQPGKIRKRKERRIWRLNISGKENLEIYKKRIGFLHPKKKKKLEEAISSYRKKAL